MNHLIIRVPGVPYVLGGFLGVTLKSGGELHAHAAFFSSKLEAGKYYDAEGSDGNRYAVKVPESKALKEKKSTAMGMREPGVESRYMHLS